MSTALNFAQSGQEVSVCEAIKHRHELSKAGLIRVSGTDLGDGALRDPCAQTIEIHGVKRPAALWIVEAPRAETAAQQDRPGRAMSFAQYMDFVAKHGQGKRREKGRSIVLVGHLQIKEDDAAISAGSPRKRYAGFGQFGLYPVQIAVALVEIRKSIE